MRLDKFSKKSRTRLNHHEEKKALRDKYFKMVEGKVDKALIEAIFNGAYGLGKRHKFES